MAAHDKNEPVYMIGVVAELTNMHAQTIRLYERLGLIKPVRRNKNRLYSQADVERLLQIRRLTQDMGVNLAGVEVILDLLNRLEQVTAERDALYKRAAEFEARVKEFLSKYGGEFP
ncbi:MAG TPA: MerR family transcriptional regulator [Chthonomonas sp.]|jgi:MerR family transcriptional regulator/heat shock protein HspR|uniref:MerR family transcriptional regulator n=1 Tax=Chthonomonas sp. TaxID=2282153 RepID=UPI002B4B941D|nr:MerR family transcriptional regulator [Chthonomonas sp.]HLH79158.1 MerR family transcriptional regulator [Chthonomonas sp.]